MQKQVEGDDLLVGGRHPAGKSDVPGDAQCFGMLFRILELGPITEDGEHGAWTLTKHRPRRVEPQFRTLQLVKPEHAADNCCGLGDAKFAAQILACLAPRFGRQLPGQMEAIVDNVASALVRVAKPVEIVSLRCLGNKDHVHVIPLQQRPVAAPQACGDRCLVDEIGPHVVGVENDLRHARKYAGKGAFEIRRVLPGMQYGRPTLQNHGMNGVGIVGETCGQEGEGFRRGIEAKIKAGLGMLPVDFHFPQKEVVIERRIAGV